MHYSTSKKILIHGFAFLMSLSFCFLLGAARAEAQYQPLTGIPGVTDTNNISLVGYINALFLLSIALGAMLAVVKIAIGGFKYMMSDVVTTKQDAKNDITGALIGLGILLATFVVLYTINPNLTNLDVLSGAERIQLRENDLPTEEEAREDVRIQYEGIGSTFSGIVNSPEHKEWIKQCRQEEHGWPVLKKGSTKIIECRIEENNTGAAVNSPTCPEGQIVEYGEGEGYTNGYRCGTIGGSF